MSPLNYLWLCSIEHFMIVLPFNYVGWEGSYCFLFFLEADSSLRVVVWGRDVLKWDSEGFEFWWTRIIFEFTIGAIARCTEGAYPLRRFGHGVCWNLFWEFGIPIMRREKSRKRMKVNDIHFLYRGSECLWVLHKYKETPRTECVSIPSPVYPVCRGLLRGS